MRIDFHTHLYPADYLELMVRVGREDFARAHAQVDDLGDRIAAQDKAGVDKQVLSFVGLNTVVADPGGATEAAQCLNDIYADVASGNDDRFRTFAMLPLPHVEAAVAEAERALASPTCLGVCLPSSISGTPLDDQSFGPLWEVLDAHAAIVFIHPVGSDSSAHWGMDAFGMGAMFGSPMQIGIAACRLVFSGLTVRYPNIRFLFAQGGGFLPSRWEAIENIVLRPGFAGHAPYMLGWVKDLDIDPDDPMGRFRDFYFDTAGFSQTPTTLAAARETYGIDRLVLGSDAQFGSLTDTVAFLDTTDLLSDAERTSLLDSATTKLGIE